MAYNGILTLALLGDNDEIFTFDLSNPSGNSWVTITHSQTNIVSLAVGAADELFIVLDDGTSYYSEDSGSTWTDVYEYYNFNDDKKKTFKDKYKIREVYLD